MTAALIVVLYISLVFLHESSVSLEVLLESVALSPRGVMQEGQDTWVLESEIQ